VTSENSASRASAPNAQPGLSDPAGLSGLPLGHLVVPLLKGVIYQEQDARLWHALVSMQAQVRDYIAVLGLELVLDEAEGYAFLRARPVAGPEQAGEEAGDVMPRLVARRPLSFPVSLLLALLRKKLAEFDASGDGDGTRLVLSRDEIVELVRVFLPENSNEAKLVDQIDSHINKVLDLGFLRKLKTTGGAGSTGAGGAAGVAGAGGRGKAQACSFEVSRILKAFVDAQWLAQFDARLAQYQAQLQGGAAGDEREDERESRAMEGRDE
jgi:hypothetical protein